MSNRSTMRDTLNREPFEVHQPSETAPAFGFTHRVGSPALRAEVAAHLAACYDAGRYPVFGSTMVRVRLTREDSATQGTFVMPAYRDENGQIVTGRMGGAISVNINDGFGWRMTAAHEVIHALQYATGVLSGRMVGGRRVRFFNHGAAWLLTQVVRGAEIDADTWTEAERHGETVTMGVRGQGTHHHYVASHHERQAFRLTPAMLRAVGHGPGTRDYRAGLALSRATFSSVRYVHGGLSRSEADAASRAATAEASRP